jgi:hypothetical protein
LTTESTKRLVIASVMLISRAVGQSFDDINGDTPAKAVAAAAWKAALRECPIPDPPGKSSFFQIVAHDDSPKPEFHTHMLYEFRDITLGPLIEDQSQSLADKLNRQQDGIQWHGHQILKAAATREKIFYAAHSGMGHDEAWTSFFADDPVLLIELTKKTLHRQNLHHLSQNNRTIHGVTALPRPCFSPVCHQCQRPTTYAEARQRAERTYFI